MPPVRHKQRPWPKELPREILSVLQRVTLLSEKDQLRTYEVLRDYLKDGERLARDPTLDERAESLRVLEAVARHYSLTNSSDLTVKQFDTSPEELRDGWNSSRVIRTWSKWKFASDALAGGKPKPTARQRATRKKLGFGRLTTDDYLSGVRDWLATKPPQLTAPSYDDWRREENATRPEGHLPRPSMAAIRNGLEIQFDDILKVARGELELDKVPKHQPKSALAEVTGPHDLVSFIDVLHITGGDSAGMHSRLLAPDAPVPVVVAASTRMWLREDIEAWAASNPFPRRKLNCYRHHYMTRDDAAEYLGASPNGVPKLMGIPNIVARVGKRVLWLRKDIEAYAKTKEAQRAKALSAVSNKKRR